MRLSFLLSAVALALSSTGCGGAGPPPAADPPARVEAIDNPAPAGARLPALASSGETVLMAWIVSRDGTPSLEAAVQRDGAWTEPSEIVSDPFLLLDPASPPAAAILADGTLAVAWGTKNPGGEYASDVHVSFSRDAGATWDGPFTPHRDGTATEHGFVSLLPDPAGGLDVLWLDGRAFATSNYGEGGTQLFHARWVGEAFGPETSVDAKVCDCCRTAAARCADTLVAAYRDRHDDERRDISVSTLSPEGDWSAPTPVHDDGWRLQACPANGPALAVQGDRTLLAWFTAAGGEPRVRAAISGDAGGSFGPPLVLDAGYPVGRTDAVPLGTAGFAVSWLEKSAGRAEVRVRQVHPDALPGSGAIVGITDAGRSSGTPRLAAAGDARALVAWTDTTSPGGVRTALVSF